MSDQPKLRHGYTTGSTAAAAAKGATLLLLGREVEKVSLLLPWNSSGAKAVEFNLVNIKKGKGWASCGVVKDGGDDPDATHGMELRASVAFGDIAPGASRIDHSEPTGYPHTDSSGIEIEVEGGEGVGRVTRKGLAASVGSPAINPVPMEMIRASVAASASEAGCDERATLKVVISAPEGAERAKRTMNARLGIIGGISILGTNGIVVPMSTAAWTGTIDATLDVAKASGAVRAILGFGRTSERAGQALFPELADNAAVLMGDHVGYALDAAAERKMDVIVVGQFAKFCKLAAGNFATHVSDSTLDMSALEKMLIDGGLTPEEARATRHANTAREVCERLLEEGRTELFTFLAHRVADRAVERVKGAISVEVVLFDYSSKVLARIEVKARGEA